MADINGGGRGMTVCSSKNFTHSDRIRPKPHEISKSISAVKTRVKERYRKLLTSELNFRRNPFIWSVNSGDL